MDTFKNIAIIFMSIFFESLPFLLLGSLISSIIEIYVSNETITKIIHYDNSYNLLLNKNML